jgi:hypothetical protein
MGRHILAATRMTFQTEMDEWMHDHYSPVTDQPRIEVTETNWVEVAQDPNAVKWDEKQTADLQKLVEDYERLKAVEVERYVEIVVLRDNGGVQFVRDGEQVNFTGLIMHDGTHYKFPVFSISDICAKGGHCYEENRGGAVFAMEPPEGGWPTQQTCKHCDNTRTRKVTVSYE